VLPWLNRTLNPGNWILDAGMGIFTAITATVGELLQQSVMSMLGGGVLGAKVIALIAVVLAVIVLVVGLVTLILSTVGAAFQPTTAVWPAPADVREDGSYLAGGWAISSRFGWRTSPFTGQAEFHDGIDIVSPSGGCPFGHRCALPAMFDGQVEYVGWDQAGAGAPQATGGGQIVIATNGQEDHRVLYAHLEPYRLHVQLQGKIDDDHGRYDEYMDYRPIGEDELTPDIDDGDQPPTGRRAQLVLDEAHALLHSEAGARALQTIFRIGRSLQFKATVITQSLDELDESEHTRVLLENARSKLLLGLNGDSGAVAAEIVNLGEQEAAYLASCRKVDGVGATALLLADGERTPLLIPMWPETIHRLITGRSRGDEVRR
jgi:hypothetical protein